MGPQLHPFAGHPIQHRRLVTLGMLGFILIQHAKVAPAHVIEQNEDHIGLGFRLSLVVAVTTRNNNRAATVRGIGQTG